MGSSMTCKLNPCCGNMRDCSPPEEYAKSAPKMAGTPTQQKRIATLPTDLRLQLIALDDAMILAVHDLMHVEMERRHGKSP